MKRSILRIGVFFALFILLLSAVSKPFRTDDWRIGETFEELYSLEPDSCDLVVVGGSNAYAYWQAPLAWRDFGITSFNLSVGGLPTVNIRNFIEEARKSQPDALYVITVNSMKNAGDESRFHNVTDYMRFSANKLDAINRMARLTSTSPLFTRLELLFPVLTFHGNWNAIESHSYDPQYLHVKSGSVYGIFLDSAEDITDTVNHTDERTELKEDLSACLDDLLDYLEQSGAHVLFVRMPQGSYGSNGDPRLNTLCDRIQEAGFDLLDLEYEDQAIGFDYTTDFYNLLHTNARGSVKFTYYLANLLQERYGFADKREDPAFAEWNEMAERYDNYLQLSLFDFELAHAPREDALAMTPVSVATVDDAASPTLRLAWDPVEGADGFLVYRRLSQPSDMGIPLLDDHMNDYRWERIAELPADASSYTDGDLPADTKYIYAVVPIVHEGDATVYGSFSTKGVSATTKGDAA